MNFADARFMLRRARAGARPAVEAATRYSGLSRWARGLGDGPKVGILCYHNPTPERLDAHLYWIKHRYPIIELDKLVDAAHSGNWAGLPDRSIVLTFDDGHKGNATLDAVLRKHHAPSTIYLCSEIVGTLRQYWWMAVEDPRAQELKRLRNADRLKALREEAGWDPRDVASVPVALTREDIVLMGDHVDFGAHSATHPILTMCSADEIEQEITESKGPLESLLGRKVRHFAYPNGDYTPREIEAVRRAGYASARTVDVGWNGPGVDPYRLKILACTDGLDVNGLSAHIGLLSRVMSWRLGWIDGVKRPILPPSGV